MDILIVVFTLLFGAVIEAKQYIRTERGEEIQISGNSSEEGPSETVGLLILEHNQASEDSEESDNSEDTEETEDSGEIEDSEETEDSGEIEDSEDSEETEDSGEIEDSEDSDQSFSYYKPKNLKVFPSNTKATDIDSSGNSEEYSDTGSDSNTQGNIAEILHLIQDKPSLRKKWKSCFKKAAKECTKACRASYGNACDLHKCKSKLKKAMKKECKLNCKDFFS